MDDGAFRNELRFVELVMELQQFRAHRSVVHHKFQVTASGHVSIDWEQQQADLYHHKLEASIHSRDFSEIIRTQVRYTLKDDLL